jgi:hypothetical protein
MQKYIQLEDMVSQLVRVYMEQASTRTPGQQRTGTQVCFLALLPLTATIKVSGTCSDSATRLSAKGV